MSEVKPNLDSRRQLPDLMRCAAGAKVEVTLQLILAGRLGSYGSYFKGVFGVSSVCVNTHLLRIVNQVCVLMCEFVGLTSASEEAAPFHVYGPLHL